MRFLVTGVRGQLGYDIVRELKKRGYEDILAFDRTDMDLTNEEQVHEKINETKPDVVFHCAAYTAVDNAEDNRDACYTVNVLGTKYLSEATKNIGAKLIYISTEYVFDGTKPYGETYDVDDIVNPQSVYGKTKYEGELETKKNPKHFIVRTSWVFGINGNNFIKTMLKLSAERDSLNVVSDQFGSPTYTVDLARLLVDLAETDKYGVYHANNEGYTSWDEFAREIFKVFHKSTIVNSIKTEEYKTKATRPKNSCLSKDSLDRAGFKRLPSWQDAILRYKEEMEEI